jgi:hypothetical protein
MTLPISISPSFFDVSSALHEAAAATQRPAIAASASTILASKITSITNLKELKSIKNRTYFYPNVQFLSADLFRHKHDVILNGFMWFKFNSAYPLDKREYFPKYKIFLSSPLRPLM